MTRTIATKDKGISELASKIKEHLKWFRNSESAGKKKKDLMRNTLLQLASERTKIEIQRKSGERLAKLAEQCLLKKTDPYSASIKLIKSIS